MSQLIYFCFILSIALTIRDCEADGTVKNPIHFPYGGSDLEIFAALAFPIEDNSDVFISYQLQANYALPENETDYQYPPIITDDSRRSFHFTRKRIYQYFEEELSSHGYPGKNCLLRAICEAAEHNLEHNGVIGNLIHIILTPSTSKMEGLPYEYQNAEKLGNAYRACNKYSEKCSLSLLSLISVFGYVG